MRYRVALDLTVRHGFWGDAPAPLRIAAADPGRLARADIVFKTDGTRAILGLPETAPPPAAVALDILAEPRAIALTEGWQADAVAVLTPAPGQAETGLAAAQETLPRDLGDRRVCRLLLDLAGADPEAGWALSLRLEPVAALWAYHVTGRGAEGPIRVIDPADEVAFEDLGQTPMPDGRRARVLRSARPVPLAARSPWRFRLEETQPAPFDPIALIPVLPAGGANLRPAPGQDGLQSDIYVSLW
ncbi:hypothetical protein BV509_12820 [Rhodovulum sulfidophilum]|uniref:Uncharacterized protein n=1 Tax=Rhodovulum visakhapatnamense TaxID=364297 RepID=A0ABS1RK31_9RHOB|nr:hypothetical protein [Rhodovulum visakhapatnamense]MBL3570522.1 hypothetical protein [Rhodovulum visakhapatnamense]MBL3579252.1 hypothetical protein [Rhodovulum visakhapatnamense]OLS45139.1 hypothetical protein BV509_12820 [Rhodovulum sulfidophilum]